MEFSWKLFVAGLLLGMLQLSLGVALGRIFSRRGRWQGEDDRDRVLKRLAHQLYRLVRAVTRDVDSHRGQLVGVEADLARLQQEPGTDLTATVLKTVAHMVELNQRFQHRLARTERRLQQQTEEVLAHAQAARTDPLTGLPNRRTFDEELANRLAAWNDGGIPCGLVMIDIDHFKDFNDRFGHPAGDHVLEITAEILAGCAGERGLVARLGGEEFAVVAAGLRPKVLTRLAEEFRLAVAAEDIRLEGRAAGITISLGVAAAEVGEAIDTLVKRADAALYAAKRAGRNRTYYHDGTMCRPVIPGAHGSDTDGAEVGGQGELAAICNSLRQTLIEVTDPSARSE